MRASIFRHAIRPGFSFEGDIILNFTGDVDGDITFSDAGSQDSDIVITINDGSVLWGNLVLGVDGGDGVATEDVVATNDGIMQSVIFDDSSNINFTNSGTIDQAGSLMTEYLRAASMRPCPSSMKPAVIFPILTQVARKRLLSRISPARVSAPSFSEILLPTERADKPLIPEMHLPTS